MPAFHLITFGCQMNAHDSGWLKTSLLLQGYSEASQPEQADIVLINTCSVREKPEIKLYELIARLSKFKPELIIAIGGCVAVQVGEALFKRAAQVRLLFNTDSLTQVAVNLEKLAADPTLRLNLICFPKIFPQKPLALPSASEKTAFVSIMQGCDNYCSYCIVPYVRGRQRSRAQKDIFKECAALASNGIVEVTLLGQNVNSWGLDLQQAEPGHSLFAALLADLAQIEGLERIRFMTSHPKDLSEQLIESFAVNNKICPHLHLPLQSGSDKILQAMGRKYDLEHYFNLVRALREARADISLTTDLIVGFPGETDQDFEATLRAMDEVAFDASFSFKYNDRPGTVASGMSGKISEAIKAERLAKLQAHQTGFTINALKGMVGKKVDVLLERQSRRQSPNASAWQGRDPHNYVVNVNLPAASHTAKGLVPVWITAAKMHTLIGEPEIVL